MKILGYEFRTSTIAMKPNDYHWRYTKVPSSSFNWRGSDWEYPTALTFETFTMQAQDLANSFYVDNEAAYSGISPELLISSIDELVYSASKELARSNRIADAYTNCGIKIDRSITQPRTIFSIRIKTWPAIEGVTVPLQDVTY